MLRVRPIHHTPHVEEWARLLTTLGLIELPASGGHGEFAAAGGKIRLLDSGMPWTELGFEIRDLDKFADWTRSDGTPVTITGDGSSRAGRITGPDGLSFLAEPVTPGDPSAGTEPGLIVLALWNTPDVSGASATLRNIAPAPTPPRTPARGSSSVPRTEGWSRPMPAANRVLPCPSNMPGRHRSCWTSFIRAGLTPRWSTRPTGAPCWCPIPTEPCSGSANACMAIPATQSRHRTYFAAKAAGRSAATLAYPSCIGGGARVAINHGGGVAPGIGVPARVAAGNEGDRGTGGYRLRVGEPTGRDDGLLPDRLPAGLPGRAVHPGPAGRAAGHFGPDPAGSPGGRRAGRGIRRSGSESCGLSRGLRPGPQSHLGHRCGYPPAARRPGGAPDRGPSRFRRHCHS